MKSCFQALSISILAALPLVAQENPDDPFGPGAKEPEQFEKAAKKDHDRVYAMAKRLFEDDYISVGRGFASDGKQSLCLIFKASDPDPKELQELILKAAATYMRGNLPITEITITVKSRNDFNAPKEDPTDCIRVSLNKEAAKDGEVAEPEGSRIHQAAGRHLDQRGL
jgi:hypothetical protein